MPVSNPGTLLGLVGALPGDLDPGDGSPVSMIDRTICSTESANAGTQSRTERPR
jgi:hypothetical protein